MSRPRFLADNDLNERIITGFLRREPAAARAIADGRFFPGLFLIRQTTPVRVAIESLLLVWTRSQQQDWQNDVVFLPL
jgi:hypothetical protein